MKRYLAFDLGAESGRAITGSISGQKLELAELHRFDNTPVQLAAGLYWDALGLYREIERGLAIAAREGPLDGIGIDTWGVDFALLDSSGALVDNPRHYRDARNNGMLERTFAVVPRREIFSQTGIQFMQLNTLYQLHAMKLAGASALRTAEKLLFMPDLFNYWLTGVARTELTIGSTSQFYNPIEKRWATELLQQLGLDPRILPDMIWPGARLGPLRREVGVSTRASEAPVFATASHDTAAAVAAAPAEGSSWCYISSGTWSLMGVEVEAPLINDRVLEFNFTNEVGFGGSIRLLKNIAGMWPLQECRRAWSGAGQDFSYDEIARLAAAAAPFRSLIDPDAFLEPGRMPERIAEFCRAHGEPAPSSPGAIARAILESLALRYRQVLESLEVLLGRRIEIIHIVGGGSRNRLLNQLVADATRRTVIAGPAEATAAGNIIVQAIGDGALADLAAARRLVRRSLALETFTPADAGAWDVAYTRFRAMQAATSISFHQNITVINCFLLC